MANNMEIEEYFSSGSVVVDKEAATDLCNRGFKEKLGVEIYDWEEGEELPSFEWVEEKHKFITEYTDKGYLKVIFGSGNGEEISLDGISDFNKWQISRIVNNNNLGILLLTY